MLIRHPCDNTVFIDMLLSSRRNEVQSFSILPCDLIQSCGCNVSPFTNDSLFHFPFCCDGPPPVVVAYSHNLPLLMIVRVEQADSSVSCGVCWEGWKLQSGLTYVDGSWCGWGWD